MGEFKGQFGVVERVLLRGLETWGWPEPGLWLRDLDQIT